MKHTDILLKHSCVYYVYISFSLRLHFVVYNNVKYRSKNNYPNCRAKKQLLEKVLVCYLNEQFKHVIIDSDLSHVVIYTNVNILQAFREGKQKEAEELKKVMLSDKQVRIAKQALTQM